MAGQRPAWLERRLRPLRITMQHGIREFRPRQPLDRQLGSETLNRILRELESLRITRVVNGTFKKLPGGTEIVVAPQSGGGGTPATIQPWDLIAQVDPDADPEDENPPYLVRVRPGTLNGILNAAKVITDATTGRHGRNPFAGFKRRKGGAGRDHRPFTEAEIDLIFARAQGEVKTACYLMLYSGQRAGDVGVWEWSRVDFDRSSLWCRQSKTGRRIELPMHQALADHLRAVRAQQRPEIRHVMPGIAAEMAVPGRQNYAAHTINRFLAGLGMKSDDNGIVGSHSFRYYFVSLMREKGVPDGIIQELVGHSTRAMLHRYSRIGMEARARAVAELPPVRLTDGVSC